MFQALLTSSDGRGCGCFGVAQATSCVPHNIWRGHRRVFLWAKRQRLDSFQLLRSHREHTTHTILRAVATRR